MRILRVTKRNKQFFVDFTDEELKNPVTEIYIAGLRETIYLETSRLLEYLEKDILLILTPDLKVKPNVKGKSNHRDTNKSSLVNNPFTNTELIKRNIHKDSYGNFYDGAFYKH